MAQGLRVVFMGTPDFAACALRALIASGHDVAAAYSQPPRPRGRGQQVQKSAVHLLAEEHDIPVFTPRNFKDAADVAAFAAHKADVAVVAAYGLILPQVILDAPEHGCLNIHGSLLPRWRGAAPIHRAILAGDDQTGITIMQMEAGLDTGPMIAMRATPITDDATTASLHDTLTTMGGGMIVDVLDELARAGTIQSTPQPAEGVTYADKITKEEARIDWTQPAAAIGRAVRAFYPFPGAWTMQAGQRLKIVTAAPLAQADIAPPGTLLGREGIVACGGGTALRLVSVQPEGKKPMDVASAVNGGYLDAGMVLA